MVFGVVSLALLAAFIASIVAAPSLLPLYLSFAGAALFCFTCGIVLLVVYLVRRRAKRQQLCKIHKLKIDSLAGLDLIHLVAQLPNFHSVGKPRTEITPWNPSITSATQKNPAMLVDEEQVCPHPASSEQGAINSSGIILEVQKPESEHEEYTLVKNAAFSYMDSLHQGAARPPISIKYDSRSPLQDISANNYLAPRHLTFSEKDDKGLVFLQSAQKKASSSADKENKRAQNRQEPVFYIDERDRVGLDKDQQPAFLSVQEDVEAVVYGDPSSQTKLHFLEKVRKAKEQNGELCKYDTLGAPPEDRGHDLRKVFPYLPE